MPDLKRCQRERLGMARVFVQKIAGGFYAAVIPAMPPYGKPGIVPSADAHL
jgi:hypothetical protein